MNIRLSACVLALFVMLPISAPAQETPDSMDRAETLYRSLESSVGEIVRIRTAGRGEFQGRLLSVGPERVELQSGEGLVLQVVTAEIVGVIVIDEGADAGAYYQDAASNKLIVIPVGFGMEPGEFHIANQELILVTASYGFSERFSLWGGLSIPGAVFNARWSFHPAETVGLSTGAFAGALFIDSGVILIPYGIATFGTSDQNFTIALGVPYFNESIADFSNFTLGGAAVVGGKIILSQTASIITENWILVLTEYLNGTFQKPDIYIAPSVAFRIAGSRFSWDLGITVPMWITNYYAYGDDYYGGYSFDILEFPIPILGFTYRIR